MSNIENYYSKFNRHIALAKAFTEVPELEFIIKSCRIKPYGLTNTKDVKIQLFPWWIDEYGNSLKIKKNKSIKIIYNDLNVNRDSVISTDLYYGIGIEKIIKISKLGFYLFGQEEGELGLFSFLGIDNYLRTFMYDGEMVQIPSLYLGLECLKKIYQNLDIKQFIEIKDRKKIGIPCQVDKVWLSCLPMSETFSKVLNSQPEKIVKYLKENK